jgi:hypothetical protein
MICYRQVFFKICCIFKYYHKSFVIECNMCFALKKRKKIVTSPPVKKNDSVKQPFVNVDKEKNFIHS